MALQPSLSPTLKPPPRIFYDRPPAIPSTLKPLSLTIGLRGWPDDHPGPCQPCLVTNDAGKRRPTIPGPDHAKARPRRPAPRPRAPNYPRLSKNRIFFYHPCQDEEFNALPHAAFTLLWTASKATFRLSDSLFFERLDRPPFLFWE